MNNQEKPLTARPPQAGAGPESTQQIQRTPLPAQVLEILRTEIVTGIWEPGVRLPEVALCERFGVSRTPLREAFKALEAEGLVNLLPNRGAIVTPVTLADIEEKLQVLRALEMLAIALACDVATDAEVKAITTLNDGLAESVQRPKKSRDGREFYFGNFDFHQAIADASHNATLIAMHRFLHRHIQRVRHLTGLPKRLGAAGLDDHEKIVAALNARDARKAQAAIGAHFDLIRERLVAAMTNGENARLEKA